MNKVSNEVAVVNRHWASFSIEPSPVRAGKVHKVLEELSFFRSACVNVAEMKELQMRWTGKSSCHAPLFGRDSFEPDQVFARAKPYLGCFEWHEAIDLAVYSKKSVPRVDLDNREPALSATY